MVTIKELLKQDDCGHVATGREVSSCEPFMFVRMPGDGGTLVQSISGGAHCGIAYISEDGALDAVMPSVKRDFKTTLRTVLQHLDNSSIEKVMVRIADLLAKTAVKVEALKAIKEAAHE